MRLRPLRVIELPMSKKRHSIDPTASLTGHSVTKILDSVRRAGQDFTHPQLSRMFVAAAAGRGEETLE